MNHCCLYHGITFVIINQITSSISEGYQQGSAVLPSLGNTVTQFTHHRFMLCRRGSTYPSAAIFDLSNVKDIAMENKNNVPSDLIRDFYVRASTNVVYHYPRWCRCFISVFVNKKSVCRKILRCIFFENKSCFLRTHYINSISNGLFMMSSTKMYVFYSNFFC